MNISSTISSHGVVPPGFRFHPTDEELVDYYLRKKINSTPIELDVIRDVDLYKIEPWDLQEVCSWGGREEEQNDWYFFSHKDKKYPTGSRTNRATVAGFWKATGRDKPIYSSSFSNNNKAHEDELVGMRKTLVFYKGRAPNGLKSDWIMHEYRLETDVNSITTQEEGWVVCRVFKKRLPIMQQQRRSAFISDQHEPTAMWYNVHDHHVSFMPEINSPTQNNMIRSSCLANINGYQHPTAYGSSNSMPPISNYTNIYINHNMNNNIQHDQSQNFSDQLMADWRAVDDKFIASQLLDQEGGDDANSSIKRLGNHDPSYPNNNNADEQLMVNHVPAEVDASTSISSCLQIDLWK